MPVTRFRAANDLLDSFDFSQDPLPPFVRSEHPCPFGDDSITTEAEDRIAEEDDSD